MNKYRHVKIEVLTDTTEIRKDPKRLQQTAISQ